MTLRPGDLILSYGETRLFAPDELVAETRMLFGCKPGQAKLSRG